MNGNRSMARDLAIATLPTMTRATIDDYRARAEHAPAFAFSLLFLASLCEEVLRTADIERFPHAEALGIFVLRLETRRAPECAVVDRVLAEEEAAAKRRQIATGHQ